MNKRIINNNNNNNNNNIIEMKPNMQLLHPLTCSWLNTENEKKNIFLTKYDYNNNFEYFNSNKCKSTKNYIDFLYIPPLGISSDTLLKIYNINDIDSLNNWINDNINICNLFTINRILNCWILTNISLIKNHNFFLKNIYLKLLKKFKNIKIKKSEFNNFLNRWINKNINNNIFYIDLFNDLLYYIKNKK
jgi:hypothetical protein